MIRLFKHYSISAFLLLILFSCQTQIIQNEIEELAQVESPTWRISKESTVLTSEDAMKVAMQFSSSGLPETRGKEFVRSIVPVKEGNEESLLYGVNFEDGYLLISGTKNYFPYYLSEMPDTICSYNANLCGFLHDLKYQIGVYTGGGSNISNVVTALQHYRYTCRQITHSADSVYSSVNNDRPVLMFGEDSSTGEGHAWVCDGTREYDTYNLYRLYVFRYEDGIPSYYDLELEEPANRINYVLFHMNWGWNGSFDGYYHDTNYLTYPQGDPYNPTYGREEILVNKPILL